MRDRAFSHLRGNVVAYAALFIALGGTAFAAASVVPANSVGTAQLKNGAVTGQKVAHSTLTGANIRSSTLGTVPNSAHLGGLTGSAFQRRISTACSSGQAMTSVSATGAPTCSPFGQGTITSVTGATGLTGSATSGGATLSVDPTVVQSRVSGSCGTGKAVASIAQSGQVTCGGTLAPVMGGSGTNVISNAVYLAPEGISTPSASAPAVQAVSPAVAMTANNLSVSIGTAPGTNNGWVFVLIVNGSLMNTPNCKILDTSTTCTDTGDPIAIPAGATVSLGVLVDAGNPAPTSVSFAWTAQT